MEQNQGVRWKPVASQINTLNLESTKFGACQNAMLSPMKTGQQASWTPKACGGVSLVWKSGQIELSGWCNFICLIQGFGCHYYPGLNIYAQGKAPVKSVFEVINAMKASENKKVEILPHGNEVDGNCKHILQELISSTRKMDN